MRKIYGNRTSDETALELKNRELARVAARESFVLLKNDGALPLSTEKIALYGMGARKTVKGGTGSGEVQERYSVNIEQGLEAAGYVITTKSWLDDYDAECTESRRAWKEMVEAEIASIADPLKGLMKARSYSYRYPTGRLITQEDIRKSETDTAVYVLMRQAGEGNDRKTEPGDFLITESERQNLKLIAEAYEKTILVINVGGFLDLTCLDEIKGIDAVVFYCQGGMEGGNALADLLGGACNFCGKLAATWPGCYEELPGAMEYSYLNGDLENENYTEGIYVGYRYYDAFGKNPRFPFGFGLSYTDFGISTEAVSLDGKKVCLSIRVKNTGAFAGKEVIQVYAGCPEGRLEKEVKRLAAFAKTEVIQPGDGEVLSLTFDFGELASYDEARAAWVLEPGDYVLYVGNSSRNVEPAAVLCLGKELPVTQCRNCCAPETHVPELRAPERKREQLPAHITRLTVEERAFDTVVVDYSEPQYPERAKEKELLDALTWEEMAELLRGGDLQDSNPENHVVLGAAGKTSIRLRHRGIPNIIFSDGPAGVNVVEHVRVTEDGTQKATAVPEKYNFGMFAKIIAAKQVASEGTDIYRYSTAWPAEMLLAQSFDTKLLEQVGEAVGEELKAYGVTVWLAPGMNIQRNPLCGRNFEYYSEDPLVSGRMAGALTRGVQRISGVGTTIKHFCCNNQEDNRNGVSANVNERTLREIYLKGFEIAVKESSPWAVMTSYNRLNGMHTAVRHDLCTDILRCEWGFQGAVMTDWNSCGGGGKGDARYCVPAGNDLLMPGSDDMTQAIREAYEEGILDSGALRRSAARVLRLILNSAVAAEE